jgi:glycosyltransferase involved in cell wall biosynthesis
MWTGSSAHRPQSGNRPLRILLLGPYPPPFGGIATALANAAPWLTERGHELFFLSDSVARGVEHPADRITVMRFASRRHWARLIRPARVLRHMNRAMRLLRLGTTLRETASAVITADVVDDLVEIHRFDVICIYMIQAGFFVAADREQHAPSVALTVFGEMYENALLAARPRLVQAVLSRCSVLLSPSSYCASGVSRAGLDPAQVKVLILGVDVDRFRPDLDVAAARAHLGLTRDVPVVLFLGRFSPDMGVDAMLAATREVLDRRREVVFVFAGAAGGLSRKVEAFGREFGDRVRVCENAPKRLLPGLLATASLLVAPTRAGHPCCGMAIKEAMACGTPVIATRTGGHVEVIHEGITGRLVDCTASGEVSVPDLVDLVEQLLADSDGRAEMGRAARQRAVDAFDARDTARRLEHLLAGICAPETRLLA